MFPILFTLAMKSISLVLVVVLIPSYSPKQNLIEILWKFVKYEWIEVKAYESLSSLLKYLKKVLDNLGQEYAINFV